MDNKNTKVINSLIPISLFTLIVCLIVFVCKYIGADVLIVKILKSIIPVFIAIFISFIIEPIIGAFLKLGIKRKFCVLLVYFLLLLIIGFLFYITIPSLIDQFKMFVESFPSLLNAFENILLKVGVVVDNDKIESLVNYVFVGLSNNLFKYISSSMSFLFDLLLGISGAIFLSFDFPKFRSSMKKYIPNRIEKPVIFYFHNFLPFVHKYFFGMLIDSVLIFVISIIGFSIIGVEYTLVIALFISITNLIPIIGPYIGGIPALIIGFSVSPSMGVSALIVVVIVQIIESNFLQPIILKNIISLHPLEGILGISLFGALFGIIGMILSPVLIIAIKLLFLPYSEQVNIQTT